jgi:hypothetical protein
VSLLSFTFAQEQAKANEQKESEEKARQNAERDAKRAANIAERERERAAKNAGTSKFSKTEVFKLKQVRNQFHIRACPRLPDSCLLLVPADF